LGVSPDINALATVIVCAVGACIVAARWLMMRGERRRVLDAQAAAP
ncbi:MAG: putrescine ABC transporter permease PotI, partial [Gammaproteobacteria bacterium]|nr:putrescine ABC transporter permease PotI [Gammaproteobacteria bacterium]